MLQSDDMLEVLSLLFSKVSRQNVPSDFLSLATSGIRNLSDAGRSNSIYLLAKDLRTKRSDGADTLLPVKRMPMGLIDYTIAFFTASAEGIAACMYSIYFTCICVHVKHMTVFFVM